MISERERGKILIELTGEYRRNGWEVTSIEKPAHEISDLPDFLLSGDEGRIAAFIESDEDISNPSTTEKWLATASKGYDILVITNSREASDLALRLAFSKELDIKTRILRKKVRKKESWDKNGKKRITPADVREWALAIVIIIFTISALYVLIPVLIRYSRLNDKYYAPFGLERQIHEQKLFRQRNETIPAPD